MQSIKRYGNQCHQKDLVMSKSELGYDTQNDEIYCVHLKQHNGEPISIFCLVSIEPNDCDIICDGIDCPDNYRGNQ